MILPARIFIFFLIAFGSTMTAYADGSKDMYPRGVSGNRAFLVSRKADKNNVLFNRAAHYVYAKENETIAVASSAQGIGDGQIILTDPDGVEYSTKGSSLGKILNRQQEISGPGVGYQPYEILVEAGKEGIWKIEFISPSEKSESPEAVRADANWTQKQVGDLIAAWDISIREETSWIEGRVFFHVLNLYLLSSTLNNENGAFYGQNYVLTKDGYIYRVDGNGSHGINFFYFVNSSGILDDNDKPSYKSSRKNTKSNFHNPNAKDDDLNITQKMWYTFPDTTMPASSRGAFPWGIADTWLYRKTQIAEINNISFKSIEGNSNYVNKKGAFIQFETNYAGRYKIVIKSLSDEHTFPKREIVEGAGVGVNKIWWDGLDSLGNLVPVGEDYPISISVALIEGEIHFPYFDMEINPKGIIIDRMNPDGTENDAAIVYWDDRDIPAGIPGEQSNPIINLAGIRSDINGHAWGSYRQSTLPNTTSQDYNGDYGAYSFGNASAMDTWSYAADMTEEIEEKITVKVADLEVISVKADKDTIELGDVVDYTVVVRNNGPSDAVGAKFAYNLPTGFYIVGAVRSFDCTDTQVISQQVINGTLNAVINLPTGCSITYHIRATTGSSVPGEVYGYIPATAGVVRPVGFTDPDATSSDIHSNAPGTAAEECGCNNIGECENACNNIKINKDVFLLEPYNERGQMALLKTVRHIDSNESGFQEAGEILEYTFTIKNIGQVTVNDIYISDPMLSSAHIIPSSTTIARGGADITVVYNYTITPEDVVRKYVTNSAMVMGKNPRKFDVKDVSGTQFNNDTPTRIDIDQKPVFSMVKQVVNQGTGEHGQFTIGDKIIYQFDVKHEGDVAVEDIYIHDENISSDNYTVAPSVLSNQTVKHQLEYIVTADDIQKGQVRNTAILMGQDQKYGNKLTDTSGLTFDDDLPTITALAKQPTGIADVYIVYQGNKLLLDILANDIAGSSSFDNSSIDIVVPPALGSIVRENGKLFYIQTDNFAYGDDSFVYRFTDRSRLSSGDTEVKISILRTIPIAVNDRYQVGYNYFVKFKPFLNDYVEHSTIWNETVHITSYPAHGQIIELGDGILEYRPEFNYTGYDAFKYIIQDKNGNWSEEATVDIEVLGFFLPNVITPNADGKNDTFQVMGSYKFDHVELEIIDRFGQRLYQSSDYKNDWTVPDNITEGTYFYIFKGVRDKEKPVVRKGSVLIKRGIFKY